MEVLRSTGAVVEVLGWDEAFVGVDTEDPEGFARSLALRVKEVTQLDCTVGIGENKLQAKIATGFGKPAGVFRLTFANWFEVLGARPTEALWGIGAKTAKKLAGLGIGTVSDLVPELAPFFVTGHEPETDRQALSHGSRQRLVNLANSLTTTSSVVAALNSVLFGSLASDIGALFGAHLIRVVAIGTSVSLLSGAVHVWYAAHFRQRHVASTRPTV